jgi:hypothetical protein
VALQAQKLREFVHLIDDLFGVAHFVNKKDSQCLRFPVLAT